MYCPISISYRLCTDARKSVCVCVKESAEVKTAEMKKLKLSKAFPSPNSRINHDISLWAMQHSSQG